MPIVHIHNDYCSRLIGLKNHDPDKTYNRDDIIIYNNELFRSYKAFADAGRGCHKVAIRQSYGHVSVIRRNPTKLPHFVANIANVRLTQSDIVHFSTSSQI